MGVEIGAESCVDGLLAFGVRDISRVEAIDDACENVGHRVAETGDAARGSILQCPEDEMIGPGIDLEAIDLL